MAARELDPRYIEKEEDIISYALFAGPALEYFKWRSLPAEDRPPIPADLELKKEQGEASREAPPPPVPPEAMLAPEDYQALQALLDKVQTMNLTEFTVRRHDRCISMKADGSAVARTEPAVEAQAPAPAAPAPKPAAPAPRPEPAKPEPTAPAAATINAPLNGTFYLSAKPGQPPLVKEGDTVKAGSTVCIVEAMKLFNEIKAASNCRILKVLRQSGEVVRKEQPLFEIEVL